MKLYQTNILLIEFPEVEIMLSWFSKVFGTKTYYPALSIITKYHKRSFEHFCSTATNPTLRVSPHEAGVLSVYSCPPTPHALLPRPPTTVQWNSRGSC